jgi:hypothetical protein
VKRETASGFEPCTIGQPMDSQLAFCPSHISTGRRIGLSLITTWSPVRVRPPEPNAGVAQW